MLSYIKLLNSVIFFIIFTVKNTPECCNYKNKKNAVKSYSNNNENINDKKEDEKDINDKKEDTLIVKRKEYFEGMKIIKGQYDICNKFQDLTKYEIDNDKLKDVINEVNKVNEKDRIFIQSDTEGKVFNIISALQVANIIDINKQITVYYNFYNGNFEKEQRENSIKLKLFEVNKNFNGTYIHLGDIIDRCNGDHQCLKSLLLILYIKQELGDKVKLICGNHELMYYNGQYFCDCCFIDSDENIIFITRLICLTAISKGQIQYLDKINIGSTNYILTHKVLYKEDINKIKDFLKDKMKEKKDLKDYDIYDLIDVVNYNFKKYYCDFFYKYDKNKTTIRNIFDNTSLFDHINGKIVIGDRVKNNYDICLDNQICGHDNHKIGECYIKDKNILFLDNYSFDEETFSKPMSNIHFFNKKEEVNKHKIFQIVCYNNKLDIKVIKKQFYIL